MFHLIDDQTYLERIAKGDKSAVGDFIDRYGGLVWSIARRFTTTEADAEDAVQEIFLDLWKSCHSFKPSVSSEATFTRMVARRRLIDRSRKRNLETDNSVEVDKIVSSSKSATDSAELAEEAKIASKFLNELPDAESQAIKLSVFDGLTHSQIANVTGAPLGTVKTHIRRGISKLRDRIGFSSIDISGGAQ